MRRVAVFVFLSFLATSAAGQEATQGEYAPLPEFRTFGKPASEADATAISALMSRFSSSWARQDVDAVVAAYAEDAEWVNAFGMVYRGHTELRERFQSLFQRFPAPRSADTAKETSSQSDGQPPRQVSLRYIGSEAAVVHIFTESSWGPSRDGSDVRRVLVTYVLGKRGGVWKIVHQMIMDVRRPYL